MKLKKKKLYGTVLYGTFYKTLFERVSITFGQMLSLLDNIVMKLEKN